MKKQIYLILLLIAYVFFGCKKDEEIKPVPDEEFKTISSVNIAFTLDDGSAISDDACINPDENYAVKIEVIAKGNGSFIPIEVSYNINGTLQKITFEDAGIKLIQVTLIEGNNRAKLIDSGKEDSILFVLQGDFELVE